MQRPVGSALLLAALLAGCGSDRDRTTITPIDIPRKEYCDLPDRTDKENALCALDADCQYIWHTGACHTPESVARSQKGLACYGTHMIERPSRNGVTCTREKNACVTHG